MLLIGLTGSIATGKSTVSKFLSSSPHSLPIIDADVLARQVVEPGTSGYAAIVKHFLPTTPDLLVEASESMPENGPDGKGRPLNRPALGRRVFGDSDSVRADRAVLNGIVHPAVRWAMAKQVLSAYIRGYWAVVLDVPLLFESRLDRFCGTAMVVSVSDPEVQMRRLMARDAHLTREDAENRVNSQGDVRIKAARAQARGNGNGVVLVNDGTTEELKKQLEEQMAVLKARSPEWWAWVLVACPPLAVVSAAYQMWVNSKINKRWEAAQAKL